MPLPAPRETPMTALLPEVESFFRPLKQIILSFSGGKDSLACWCLLRELGLDVRPFYMQMIPGLSWIEEYLGYLERHFGVHILRVQHPQTYAWLRTMGAQPPHRLGALRLLKLPRFDYPDVEQGVRWSLSARDMSAGGKKVPYTEITRRGPWKEGWVAVGTRTADSPHRKRSFERLGWKRETLRKVYPIFNMLKADLIAVMKRHDVKLSRCYKMFSRSFDGVDFRYLDAIRTDFPGDYRRILEWCPMVGAEFARVKFAQKHGIATIT